MSRLMRASGVTACAAVCWAVVAAAHAQAAVDPPAASGTESLGGRLMEGLPVGPDLPAPGAAAPTGREEAGEDARGPSAPLPLVRVQYGMRTAQALLAKPKGVDQAGRVQDEIVAELDALIAELSKQCRSCAACQDGGQKPGASRRSQAARAAANVKPGRGSAPARDSTDRLDRAAAQPVDAADVEDLLKNLWGHLPERVREQMLQTYSGEFLPKYELEIEKYYRRLAEEEDERPAD